MVGLVHGARGDHDRGARLAALAARRLDCIEGGGTDAAVVCGKPAKDNVLAIEVCLCAEEEEEL